MNAQMNAQNPPRTARWPRWLRRGPMEGLACALIGAGVLMLLQPLSIVLYTYSFVTTLAGTAMFIVVSKFPD
jgi:CO dehydrogenase/acetyl-CoA synthase delta subunit